MVTLPEDQGQQGSCYLLPLHQITRYQPSFKPHADQGTMAGLPFAISHVSWNCHHMKAFGMVMSHWTLICLAVLLTFDKAYLRLLWDSDWSLVACTTCSSGVSRYGGWVYRGRFLSTHPRTQMGGKPPMIGPRSCRAFSLLPKGLIRSSRKSGLGGAAAEQVQWEPLYPHWKYNLLQDLELYIAHLWGSQYTGSVQR